MYHEEEIKRLHQALGTDNTYGQVSYNYDDPDSQPAIGEDSQSPKASDGSQDDDDQAFVLPPELEAPEGMILPDTQKLNAIITKTATFISRQGSQMEILIKAKQSNNPQFSFLSIDGALNPYYKLVLEAIKNGKYNPDKEPDKKESESEESDDGDESYLHPSLASSLSKVEAAPSIPSIQYKPSENCAYSMLVNKITGKQQPPPSDIQMPVQQIPPPGYYPPASTYPTYPPVPQQYIHGPVIYGANGQPTQQSPAVPMISATVQSECTTPGPKEPPAPLVPYGPTPPKPLTRPSFIVPPADVQIIIDKMASYVAKNGRDFEAIVKAKGDPRFNFLELSHQYHGYYVHKLTINEGAANSKVLTEEELIRKQEPEEEKLKKIELQKKQMRMEEVYKRVKMIQPKKKNDKQITTVSFSIKKTKDNDNSVIEKRSALPIEESDDENENNEKQDDDDDDAVGSSGGGGGGDDVAVDDIDNDKNKDKDINNKNINLPIKKLNSQFENKLITDNEIIIKKINSEENELVDLTDDILEDYQNQIKYKQQVDDKIKDKLAAAARDKLHSRERQLQLERRKKATMFLSQIQVPNSTKTTTNFDINNDITIESDEINSIPSPNQQNDQMELRIGENLLTSKSKNKEQTVKRSRPRSRTRTKSLSRSRSHSGSHGKSDRHRSHKKYKKKKSSHKSYDSPSRSRSHRSKKTKKSSSRHRTRSRSPARRRSRTSKNSSNSDSVSS
ncbi:splicing factor, suppressor of white-apricot homolog isoform X2 [Aphidius gifuensis]|nr:splicing factor, suppressor of white-apricot homolog isoform X2 [Aphidius gifuensis]